MSGVLKNFGKLLLLGVIVISCLKDYPQPSGIVDIEAVNEISISGGELPSKVKKHALLGKGKILLTGDDDKKYLLEFSGSSITVDSKQESPKLKDAITKSKTSNKNIIKNSNLDKRNLEAFNDRNAVVYAINTPKKISGGEETNLVPKTFVYVYCPSGQVPHIGIISLTNIQNLINNKHIYLMHFHNTFHPKSASDGEINSVAYLGNNPSPDVKSGTMSKTEFKNLLISGPALVRPLKTTDRVSSSIAFPVSKDEVVVCLHLDGEKTYTKGYVYKAKLSYSAVPQLPPENPTL